MFFFFYFLFFLLFLLLLIFFLASKNEIWDHVCSSSFECGFSAYFFSRFSFCIHYFVVALIFLFLDLELCLIMPIISNVSSSFNFMFTLFLFVFFLLAGLFLEWADSKLDWLY